MVPTKKYVFGSLPGYLLLMCSLFRRGPLFCLTPNANAKPACLLHDTPTRSEKTRRPSGAETAAQYRLDWCPDTAYAAACLEDGDISYAIFYSG